MVAGTLDCDVELQGGKAMDASDRFDDKPLPPLVSAAMLVPGARRLVLGSPDRKPSVGPSRFAGVRWRLVADGVWSNPAPGRSDARP